ncbi:haloacid dehalogenase-like hydrolase [Sphingomonas sp. TREG-RG-20F-R18-01]|uniref:HAD family hydrolase n=1 Tax=Sphingomonas sp. TREG-RG-20F-R18-01 TaxID=2914982 RepID=UPI001F58CA89|nr:haloacid dehalogenase-like hydrolase [Sphingomonas sp. TREG-RG-20F-R18-01]
MHQLAVYDMDKTITYAPTWTKFLVATARAESPWRLLFLPVAAIAGVGYGLRVVSRPRLKEIAQRLLLGGRMPEATATRAAARFAEQLDRSGIYRGARDQIAADRAAGYRIVMATASYGFYAEAIAARLGFDDVIATGVVREGGTIRAKIAGENCYGPAKLTMIQAWLADHGMARTDSVVRFYSDHASDAPSLEWADVGIAVNPHPPLRTMAALRGWAVEDWAR